MALPHDRLGPPWIPPAAGRANRNQRVITVDRRRVLWTPAATTTALWLDAADASTVTTVGGNVSQWNDKSGNSRNVTQGTAASRPAYTSAGLNNLNVITFDGTADTLINTSAAMQRGVSGTTVYVVARPGSNTAAQKGILQVVNSGGGSRTFVYYDTSAGFTAAGRRVTADSFQSQTGAAYSSGVNLAAARYDYAGATLTLFENGTQTGTRTFQTAGSVDNDAGALYIGATSAPAAFWNGIICEIIAIHSASDTTSRQRIEGYLAHKWGLTASLPGGHPFLTFPPYL